METIFQIINDAARAYQGVIPADQWHEPYMPREELEERVQFWGYPLEGRIAGVMGIQHVDDVTLFRHAYVRRVPRNKGIGAQLLKWLSSLRSGRS